MREVHDCLDGFGFIQVEGYGKHTGQPCFQGSLELLSGLQVKIHIRFPERELGFPVLKLIDWQNNQSLRDRIETAHIQSDGTLCHSDTSKTWWDASDAAGSLNLVLHRTLDLLEKNERGGESLVDDFQAYWQATEKLFFHPRDYQGHTFYQLLTHQPEKKISPCNSSWIVRGGHIPKWLSNGITLPTTFFSVDLSGEPNIPSRLNWPPENCADLFKFLSCGSTNFAGILCKQLCYRFNKLQKKKRNELFDSKKEAISIGLLIRWNKEDSSAIGVKTTLSQQAVQSLTANRYLGLASILKTSTAKVNRYSIEKAHPNYLYSKKNIKSTHGLEGKSILLIGCGAIGGYLAQHLVGLGAGLSRGAIKVCDLDVLKLDNISRHVLGMNSLGMNKAKAIADDILKRHPYINIDAITKSYNSISTESLKRYDLIINATGSMEVGVAVHQKLKKINDRPPILHSWIHGQGLAVVTFFSSKSPCFRCLWHIQNQELKFRFEISKFPEDDEIVDVGCHNSFMPYSQHAAISAASLTTRTIKKWIDGTLGTTLNFDLLRPDRCKPVSNKTPTRLQSCQICN